MTPFFHRLYRALRRVIPDCIPQTQAVAFNMFLASFPMLLVTLGTISASVALRTAFIDGLFRLRPIIPPGGITLAHQLVTLYSEHSLRWVTLGLGGTLLAGTQMMKLLMDAFRTVHGDANRQSFKALHLRALLLLCATIIPAMLTVNLIVFGKQVRGWMLENTSMAVLIRGVWIVLYVLATLLISAFVLSMIYRIGRPGPRQWSQVLPGAFVATLLWWCVSAALGIYLRHVPYSLIYGGLAVTIGLMLWMQLTATIVLIGAAYNAELERVETDNVVPWEYTIVRQVGGRQR